MKIYKNTYLHILLLNLFALERCFTFSVIIAIYNSARYLKDSIGSLFNQTIDFKRIQVILVNDGSTDETEELCLKYQTKFEKNIVYIKIEHSGVSKARNIGMNYARGKFINFLDADDKWDYRAFHNFQLFFKYYKNIDLAAGRIKFFEAEEKYHPLDYKFYKTRIVNLSHEYDSIQLSASSCFFRKSSLKSRYFKEDVFFCEDSRFVNTILLSKPIMGLIKESIYNYRRRSDFSSAINNQKKNLDFYFGTLKNVSNYLINSSIFLYKKIVPFIQFLIAYDLLFRIQQQAFKILGSENLKKYSYIIEEILNQIDDRYILEQKILSNKYKFFTLSKKYKRDLRYDIELKNNSFIYSNYKIINLETEKYIIVWKILNIKNNTLYLEAIDNLWLPRENYYYFFKLGNKTFIPKYYGNSNYDFFTMYGLVQKGRIISFKIPLEAKDQPQILYFYISYMNKIAEIFTYPGLYSHIPPIFNGYYISENYIMKHIGNRLTLFKYNQKLEIKLEQSYCYELKKFKKDYLIDLRKYAKYKKNRNNKIWIINDKYNQARDNGEYFFRYLKSKEPKGLKLYFAIKKDCYDYKRLKKIGNILDLNSVKYLKIFLISNKIISSVSYEWVDNPFKKDRKYVKDLFHFDFIYLNNGIIKDDLSCSLGRLKKNYSLFVTSSKREYKSILNSNYGYNEDNVILTGMPRYDYLQKLINIINIEKKILVAPTWRVNIKGTIDPITHESIYSHTFKFTKFFEFYNNLINSKSLILAMKKNNYTGILCLHPFFESQWIDFNGNDFFFVMNKCDYKNILFESSILITDYSSIFFDFGYLKKPVIYTHFDYEEYRNSYYKKGYFVYELDGFGPICKDLNCTINEIIFELENGCIIRKKYLKNIKKFFSFYDGKNSERIFDRIIKKNQMSMEKINIFNYAFLLFLSSITLYKLKKFYKNRNY